MRNVLIFSAVIVVVMAGVIFAAKAIRNNNQSANTTNTAGAQTTNTDVAELKIEDTTVGTGKEAVAGSKVKVHYLGTLLNGTKFDSSYDRGEPIEFTLGKGEVIEGWDKGLIGMHVGGKRKLTIPSSQAYGNNNLPGIPGGSALVFEVELIDVN
jgi:FKBP-type peptidyl-prolyl cis-trans isomerase FkpA